MTHIRNSGRAATAFRNLQRDGIIADHRSQDRESPVEEEEEVDWHEEDDPRAVQPVKKGETPQSPTCVLELKLPVPTRWSSVWYMIERCAVVIVVWHPFHEKCSCLFAIASVCEWSYLFFRLLVLRPYIDEYSRQHVEQLQALELSDWDALKAIYEVLGLA